MAIVLKSTILVLGPTIYNHQQLTELLIYIIKTFTI